MQQDAQKTPVITGLDVLKIVLILSIFASSLAISQYKDADDMPAQTDSIQTNMAIGNSGVRAISQQHPHKANAGDKLSKCTFSQLMTIGSVSGWAFIQSKKIFL